MPFEKRNKKGFQPGESGNPKGAPTRERFNLKWEIIDGYIAKSTKIAFSIVDGTDEDMKLLDDPKDRLDAKTKAIALLVKLAPQRQAGADGGDLKVNVNLIQF